MHIRRSFVVLFVLALMAISAVAAAQAKPVDGATVITFDGMSKGFEGIKPVRYNSPIQLKLVNINSFAYVYAMSGTNVDYHLAAAPAALGSFVGFSLATTSSSHEITNQAVVESKGKETYQKLFQDFINAVKDNDPSSLNGIDPSKPDQDLAKNIETLMYHGKLADPQKSSDSNFIELSDQQIRDETLALTKKTFNGDGTDPEVMVQTYLRKVFNNRADTVQVAYYALAARYWADLEKLADGDPPVPSLIQLQKQADAMLTEANGGFKDADKKIAAVEAYVKAINSVAKETKDGIYLSAVKAGGDAVEIRVTTSPSDGYALVLKAPGTPNPKPTNTYQAADIAVYDRAIVDFSFGAIYTTLKDSNYFTDPTGNVYPGSDAGYDIQAGVLAHWYRTPYPGKVILTPTVGITASSTEPRILAGVSFCFGSAKTRLYLTAGAAFGKVQELNNVGTTLTASPTVSVNRCGAFVGLTATFFSH